MCFRSQSPSAAKARIPKARMERKTTGFRRQTVLKRIHLISGNRLRISEFPNGTLTARYPQAHLTLSTQETLQPTCQNRKWSPMAGTRQTLALYLQLMLDE